MDEDLTNALETLETKLAGANKTEVKNSINDLKAVIDTELKAKLEAIETANEADKVELKAQFEVANTANTELKTRLNELETKLSKKGGMVKTGSVDSLKELITSNYAEIKLAGDTKQKVKVETKDMTLGNALTGDQPRDYNFDVVKRPLAIANVSDLATAVPISGGTYTFVRSTLASGAVANQTEGALKAQLEYDYAMIDANTDFIAGIAVYSKKMRNNLPFLESTLSMDLRKDYLDGEDAIFQVILAAQATASTQIITGQNKIEMLIAEIATLAGTNFMPNNIVVTPADYYDILVTEKSTGAGYGLPGIVSFENGTMRINGILVRMANWIPANKYYVGDWSRVRKPVTEGFSLTFSEDDVDNFRKNNITAKVEQQVTIVVEQPDALIYGDFTAV